MKLRSSWFISSTLQALLLVVFTWRYSKQLSVPLPLVKSQLSFVYGDMLATAHAPALNGCKLAPRLLQAFCYEGYGRHLFMSTKAPLRERISAFVTAFPLGPAISAFNSLDTGEHLGSLGVRLQNNRFANDSLAADFQQIRLYSDLEQNISRFLRLEGHGHYIVGTQTNDLFLQWALNIQVSKYALKAFTHFNRFSVPWLYQQLLVNKNQVWLNNFDRSTQWSTGGTLTLGNLVVDGRYSLLGNWLYFDSLALASQTKKVGHLVQFKVHKSFHFGPFSSYYEVGCQETGLAELPLPTWTTRQAVSGEFYLFRKRALHTRIVLDLNWNSAYYAPAFSPVIQPHFPASSIDLIKILRISMPDLASIALGHRYDEGAQGPGKSPPTLLYKTNSPNNFISDFRVILK